MCGSSIIAAGVSFARLVGSFESAARGGAVLVNRAVCGFTDFAPQSDALGSVFFVGAPHTALKVVLIHGQVGGDGVFAVLGFGFAPIELHAKECAARSAG